MIKPFPSSIAQTIMVILISIILASPLVGVSEYYFTNMNEDIKNTFLFIALCIIFIATVLITNKKRKVKSSYNFKTIRPSLIPLIILIVVIFKAGIDIPLTRTLAAHFNTKTNFTNPLNNYIILFGSIILAPLFEEFIFRGIILKGFLNTYNAKKAVILSTVIFAVVHVSPTKIFGALLLGLFLGWIYYETNSLGSCILIHFSANFTNAITSYMIYRIGYSSINAVDYSLYGSITFYIIAISAVAIFILIYGLYHQLQVEKLPARNYSGFRLWNTPLT
jgi:membrane protease YdiL (CAAX protease family)